MTAAPAQQFLQTIQNGIKYKLFLLKNLPAAYFSGVRLQSASPEHCTASVPYKWATKNPFRSTYFACLAMAAEMSTGVLAMAHLQGRKPRVSMLVVGMESKFYKKATGITFFTCREGGAIKEAVEAAVQTGVGQTVRVQTTGTNGAGEVIAEFWFTWSFRQKG
ncbi:MAG: DUF4442 domain-containing protein [Chitinophagaceae bacterium]